MRRKSLIVVIDKKPEKISADKNFANAEQSAADLLAASAENNSDATSDRKVIKPVVGTSVRTGRSSSNSRSNSSSRSSSRTGESSRSGSSSGSRSGSSSGSRSGSSSGSRSGSSSGSRSGSRSSSGYRNKPIVGLGYRSGKSKSESSSRPNSDSSSKSSSRYKTDSLYRQEKKPIVGTKLRSSKSGTRTSGKSSPNIFSKITSKLGFRSRKKVSSAWILVATVLILVLTIELVFVSDTILKYGSTFSENNTITAEIKALNDPLTVKKDEYIDNFINNILYQALSPTELASFAKKYWKYELKVNGSKVTDSFVQYVPNGLKIELFEREKERVFPLKIHLSGALSGGKADDVLSSHLSFVPDDGFSIKNEKYNETDSITGEKYKVTKVTYTFASSSDKYEDRVEIKADPELALRIN